MTPELSIVKLFLEHDIWKEHGSSLKVDDFPRELQGVVRALYRFHSDHDGLSLSVADLANIYFATNPPNREYAAEMFATLETLVCSRETTLELVRGIKTNNVMRELSVTAYEIAEGRRSINSARELLAQLEISEKAAQDEDFSFVSADLEELANGQVLRPGLRWRLNTLNRMLGSLRVGDFGFIFARPETGKTTLLASEVTNMAKQTPDNILWFNNEEQGEKVMIRCIQSALGLATPELFANLKANRQRFMDEYGDRIKIYDSSQITQNQVERACAKYKPALIVFDQIDKIQSAANDREDLRLGSIYQWGRELAKEFAPVIGVCQADGTGENVRWLNMGHVANAKTAKQAEADWILGVGKVNDPGYDFLRYLHASKNKLIGDTDTDPSLRHGRCEVLIRPDIGRYEDLEQ